ncbi:DNA helicase [Proteus phage PM2]|uniref:DNA helicase n=1 Tax=Proteus phage PM2 TaxID=2025809 RepID=A0A249XX00_9CAUD|nr:DNA helicase [Proteus phage PM2]ASZ76452.1 DNA helicase [Proteus phage PM2]
MDIKLKFYDYSSVKIECEDSIFFELRDYFSFETPGYQFNPKFKYGQWDGKIRILGYDGLLPYGLVDYVKKFADNMDYKVEIDPKITDNGGITEKEISDWVDSKEVYSGSTKITPHWYQKDSVVKGLTQNRALLNLPTSAGKSLIQALLARYYIENFQGKVLILVPTTILVKQMIDDLVDYRLFSREMLLGIKGGTAKDSDALVYVSTWQTAIKQPKEWFEQFGMLMNDECFDGDTLIKTPKGDIKIKDLKPGDPIYSYNEKTKEIVEDEVVKLHKNLTKSSSEKMYELEMDNNTIIKVTGNHKFLTENCGWVRADELTELDDIVEWK